MVSQKNISGLAQDCSNSIVNALELLQSCTKPTIWYHKQNNGLVQLDDCSAPNPTYWNYRKLSNIRRTKSQSLNASRLIL